MILRNSAGLKARPLIAAVLTVFAIAIAALFRDYSYYPYIVIKSGHELRATFLHKGRADRNQCVADVTKYAAAIRESCAICEVLQQSCLEKLDTEQRRTLNAPPLKLPSIKLPDGIVTFGSQDPETALAACRQSEHQSASGPGGSIVKCHVPGSPRALHGIQDAQSLKNLVVNAIVSFLLTISLILVLAPAAIKIGLVDKPSERKRHLGEIPLIGGISMCLAFMLTAIALVTDTPRTLFLSVIVLAITGLLDDLKELSATRKLFAQILAVVLMSYVAGIEVSEVGDLLGTGTLPLGFWAIPFTVFGVVGVINATNMIDGLDGLAGGISLTASLWLVIAAYLCGEYVQTALLAILAATISGFLIFNLGHPWHKRTLVFMGDTGSLFLGFLLAWFAVDLCQGDDRHLYPISAVWVLGLPLLDTVSLMIRRALKGISPFTADRQHVHHILLAAGMSQNIVVLVLVGTSFLFGAIGISGWYFELPESFLFWGYLTLFSFYYLAMHNAWKVKKFL